MKPSRKTITIYMDLPVDRNVEVEVSYHIDNDGIGAYEFWGAPGFDRGVDYAAVDKIVPVFYDETPQEQTAIFKYLDENEEEVYEEVTKQFV